MKKVVEGVGGSCKKMNGIFHAEGSVDFYVVIFHLLKKTGMFFFGLADAWATFVNREDDVITEEWINNKVENTIKYRESIANL